MSQGRQYERPGGWNDAADGQKPAAARKGGGKPRKHRKKSRHSQLFQRSHTILSRCPSFCFFVLKYARVSSVGGISNGTRSTI